MKVRIGVSLGPAGQPGQFAAAVDLLEQEGVDSLWLPENVYSPSVEPFTGMAFALARTRQLKAGSGISVLPGRHPVLVAKQLASLAGLAPARVLPVFGLQPAQPAERPLFPVPDQKRAAVFDESLALLRLLLTTESVTFHGEFFAVEDAKIEPPAGQAAGYLAGRLGARRAPADRAPGRRLARLPADPGRGQRSGCHHQPGRRRRRTARRRRPLWPQHPRRPGRRHPRRAIAAIRRRRPDTDPQLLVAAGWDGAQRMIEQYVEAGLSKFVVRPAARFEPFGDFVDGFVKKLKPLQN